MSNRIESIAPGDGAPAAGFPHGVEVRPLVDGKLGARGVSTFTLTLPPGAEAPYHRHNCGKALTLLEGAAVVETDGEQVSLTPLDCIYLPAGSAHRVRNVSGKTLLLHGAFASHDPQWDFEIHTEPSDEASGYFLRRIQGASGYELATGTDFHDLFAGRFGAKGICGGWARFEPGSSLPCHFHEYDESITIIEGRAVCEVEGRRYELSGCDTALVPKGLRHRFLNLSSAPMAMIWVYAGDEPSRTVVDEPYCSQGPK